ncbi:MAG: glucose-1-phosphate adenylyltransferase [Pseudomonadota bacterium]
MTGPTSLDNVLTLILGGGRGTRLYPLTRYRAKPAVPLGGKYRLIDIPISNCINSGLRKIFLLTQFQSHSLHKHVSTTYNFDQFSKSFIEILAAEQTEESSDWYQGTADALYHHRGRIDKPHYTDVLVLSGDQLYRMDYSSFIAVHRERQADVTIAVLPMHPDKAAAFGILKMDRDGWIREFHEKSEDSRLLAGLEADPEQLGPEAVSQGRRLLGSMGIYVFRKEPLLELLADRANIDFGRHLIPAAIRQARVRGYIFEGYWEDIGTISNFYRANVAMTRKDAPFSFHDARLPIYTRPRFLPPSRVAAEVSGSIIAEGCLIEAASIVESVIGVRSIIGQGTSIRESVLMGADYYECELADFGRAEVPIGIGEQAVIERAIIDKNARIGAGAKIVNTQGRSHEDGPNYYIRDGIVIIPKNFTVKPGQVI